MKAPNRPLLRTPPTDPKRPWLDWKRDEPEPVKYNAKARQKSIWGAYFTFLFLMCIGAHRAYLNYGGVKRWLLTYWSLSIFGAFLSLFLYEKMEVSFQEEPLAHLFYGAYAAIGLYILYKEFRTIRPALVRYNESLK